MPKGVKLSTRWTASEDSYIYHMANKGKLLGAMLELCSSASLGFSQLSGLILKKEWCEPGDGDFPNYSFVYRLANDYCSYAANIEKPIAEGMVYENVVRYLASLAKQDPAYYSRFNGIMFRVLHDFDGGRIEKTGNLDYLKLLIRWWDVFDGRERNHEIYLKFLNHISSKYETEPFYTKSIDYCLNWIGDHGKEFVYSDDMNPKRWYGNCGVGFMENMSRGGMG